MSRPQPEDIQRVGILGTGVIGGGWALHFLRLGLEVVAFDPGAGAREKLGRMVAATWPTLEKLGLREGASPENLSFVSEMGEMTERAEVIQESTPESLESKQELLGRLDSLARPETVILSSTSGLAMSDMQKRCTHPERTVIGHPFNPPYLIPLVEVVGGVRTDPEAVDWAVSFYRAMEKKPIKMEQELSGFIANRLQEALWREALHMVAEGEASVEEIDDAIRFGPGLRWAIMGPCLTFHLAGGEEGMSHMLDHFGPALKEPWTRLEAPELTAALRNRMVNGCEEQSNGRRVAQLVQERDECLIGILKVLQECRGSSY